MAKNSQNVARTHTPRKGDGTAIDVVHRTSGAGDGAVVQVGLDLNDAPVPARRYVADVGSVVQSRGEVKVIFGQEKVGTSALRSMLIVQMSAAGTSQFLQSFAGLSPSVDEIARTVGAVPEQLSEGMVEPEQAVSFAANFAAAAIAGQEACLDFYHASPFSLRSVHFIKKLSVEPVVRVDLRLPLLKAIIDELKRIDSQVSAPIVVS
ncbi:hypothetical protein GCM10009080_47360 [Cupriavidus pauculus]